MSAAEAVAPRWRAVRRLGVRAPGAVPIACAIPLLILLLGAVLPALTGYGTDEFVADAYLAPSLAHPFGTDQFGRDVMVRSFAAAKIDYLIPGIAVTVSVVVGSMLGVLAAISGRRADWLLLRVTDAIIAFPFVVLVLVLVVVVGADFSLLGLPDGAAPALAAIVLTGWAYYARLARSQALSLRNRDFVAAARLMGYSNLRITVRHILPTVLATSLAYAVGDLIVTVALIASLSFLGAGVAPPTPEWGQMMYEGRDVLETAWWLTLFPATLIAISSLALATIADAMVARLEGRS